MFENYSFSENEFKWLRHYEKLCLRSLSRGLDKSKLNYYSERHHIIPRCLGGSENNNLVLLTPAEHYVAHQLLSKIFPNNLKLLSACQFMCTDSQGERINNKLFEWIKTNLATAQSISRKGQTKETCERVAKMALSQRGKTKSNDPGTARGSIKRTGRTKENDLSVAAMALKKKGRTKENDLSVKSQSEKRMGWTKENHEGTAAQAEKMTGRTKENHSGVKLNAERRNKLTIEHRQLLVLAKNSGISFIKIYSLISKEIEINYSALPQIYRRECDSILVDLCLDKLNMLQNRVQLLMSS